MKKKISITAAERARCIIFMLLSALLVVCASVAAAFLLRGGHASAEEREDGAAFDTPHSDGEEEEEEEDFFDIHAEYAEEYEADQPPADSDDEDHHDHDETEEWEYYKIDTSTKTQAYKLRSRLAARGASVKEDAVKRRRSFGCDGILIQVCRSQQQKIYRHIVKSRPVGVAFDV